MVAFLFYVLSAVSVLCALLVVLMRNPVHSVLSLIIAFFAIAGHYVLLNAQFLAIVHVIVYAGAIMVLFLFVLMILNLNKAAPPYQTTLVKVMGAIAGGLLLVTMVASLKHSAIQPVAGAEDGQIGLVKNLGKALFTEYVVPFEISSILFLAAMVGAVTLGMRNKKDNSSAITHL